VSLPNLTVTSPLGLVGLSARIVASVCWSVLSGMLYLLAAASRNNPLIDAVVNPVEDKSTLVTPLLLAGLVRVKLTTVSLPVGNVCAVSTVSTSVPVDCVQLPADPKIEAPAPLNVTDPSVVALPVSPDRVIGEPADIEADGWTVNVNGLSLLAKLPPSVSVAVSNVSGGTVGLATTPKLNVGNTNIMQQYLQQGYRYQLRMLRYLLLHTDR